MGMALMLQTVPFLVPGETNDTEDGTVQHGSMRSHRLQKISTVRPMRQTLAIEARAFVARTGEAGVGLASKAREPYAFRMSRLPQRVLSSGVLSIVTEQNRVGSLRLLKHLGWLPVKRHC